MQQRRHSDHAVLAGLSEPEGRTDIIVVGGGPAGLAAAWEAARLGAEVLVVDRAREVGGAARGGGGGTLVAGSRLQKRFGFRDTPDLALRDWVEWGGADVDREWARRYVEKSLPEVYLWLERLGVHWERLVQHEGNSVPRWHAPRGGGREIANRLAIATRSLSRIRWRLATQATALRTEGGRVTGVTVRVGDGRQHEYEAPVTVLTSGGFCSDWSMIRSHAPAPAGAWVLLGGASGALGDGHRMLEAVDAQFVALDAVWMYPYGTPDPWDRSRRRGHVLRGIEEDIWVTRAGHQFHNEALRGGASGTVALLGLPEATCWSIFDARVAATLRVADAAYARDDGHHGQRVRQLLDESPFIVNGATLRETAGCAGIDASQLVATVTAHNHARSRAEHRDHLGRPLLGLRPLDQPPFYAVQLFPLARKNLGGVRTDLDCQVLDEAGRTIPGLFAAGEVAGMAGGHINGSAALEGTMLGPSLYSGRIAGRRAAS